MLFSSNIYADVYVKDYNLHSVDEGGHLDWDYDTKYYSAVVFAQNKWNAYKSGVIREDSLTVIQDIFITDYYSEEDGAAIGVYDVIREGIYFNEYYFVSGNPQSLSNNGRKHAAMHEFGHALCLDHSPRTDAIMYEFGSQVIELNRDDKDSYDNAAQNWEWR